MYNLPCPWLLLLARPSVSLTLARRLPLAASFPETLTSIWLRKLPSFPFPVIEHLPAL